MEDSSEARPNAAEPKEQQTVPKGSRQAQGESGPAVAEPTRQKQVTRRKKNRSKHQRRKRTPSVRTATTADSSCFLKPTEKAKSQPRKGEKQARSVTDVVGDNEHADPTTSCSQVAATVVGGLQTGLDESRCPPSATPPQVAPVLSPPSTSFYVVGGVLKDSDKEPSGAFLSPGQPLVPWSPVSLNPEGVVSCHTAPDIDTTRRRSSVPSNSQSRAGGKQARSVTDVVGDNEHADPTTSGSQVAATVVGGTQTELDESRCPPSATPPQVAPVLSPPSTSFCVVGDALKDSDEEPSGVFLFPGAREAHWSPDQLPLR
ncbi:uncharacterized protein LOC144121720 isoform X2 [Amblyomma americanum]